jgi:hypothetical protein
MLNKVLRVSDVRHWLYLVAKPPHVGVDVDRLFCTLHLMPMDVSLECRVNCSRLFFLTWSSNLSLGSPYLVTPRGVVPDSHRLFSGVRDPWGDLPCSSGEGSSPWVL